MKPPPAAEELARLADRFDCQWEEQIPADWIDRALVGELSVDFLRGVPCLPVRTPDGLRLACADPAVESLYPELGVLFKGEVEPVLVPASALITAVEQCFARNAPRTSGTPGPEAKPADREDREDLLRQSEEAPVAARVNRLLLEGLELGASDIHLEPKGRRLEARFRVDGVLIRQQDIESGIENAVVSRIKIMGGMDVAERRLPQDGNARVRVGNREVDIRVSCLPVVDGERLVLRLLGREQALFSLPDLGMPSWVLKGFSQVLNSPHGVCWVTGPTGSGKTTTLYAALQQLDTEHRNVLTIEDPVEYQLPGIGQMAIQSRIGLSFAAGLRSILRQDPDVILVGETRDEETAEIVVRASMTGHLVLSTLHANDSVSAALRLVDMGVESFLVAEATRGALAQRLVRHLCPHCARPEPPVDLPPALEELNTVPLKSAVGCPRCRDGYKGRVGLFEWLNIDSGLRKLIRDQADQETLRDAAKAKGFQDLWVAAGECLREGVTSLSEVRTVLGEGN